MTSAPPPRRRLRTEWIAAAVAVLALVVSVLSLMQSRDASEKAQRQAEREQAVKVSFIRQSNADGTETLSIANHGHLPIHDITLTFPQGDYMDVGSMDGCTVWWVTPLSQVTTAGETVSLDEPSRLYFTDVANPSKSWLIEDKGPKEPDSRQNRERNVKPTFLAGMQTSQIQHCG
ncbi:hypothetical protein ABT025_15210 [Streptomyces sp. NPDC002809]|uniref:hypothetical protein n=1 Tax=Streptomyces sp. NPDC002809 TaxID=3154433 RepID=UPI00331ACE45